MAMRSSSLANNPLAITRELDGRYDVVLQVRDNLDLIDQVSGILAAKREALEHPGEKKYGISSKRMVLGIFKKAGYILTIVVATMVDILMDTMMEYIGIKSTIKGSFCLLITVWFILGEAISILENASRMGVKVPRFFRKIII